ncbi:MAG: hypothetical protein JRK53_10150 [Deltaproteobacteria bacterium]|nr:hypothetical protein [Deltaproteobacteria bacterium]
MIDIKDQQEECGFGEFDAVIRVDFSCTPTLVRIDAIADDDEDPSYLRAYNSKRSAIELGLFGDYLKNGENIISLSSNPLGGSFIRMTARSSQGPLLSSQ